MLTGARQLDRFRWVVRFALPTIIITGLIMAWNYSVMPLVFITCPLFRHCSPVQGVCNADDLGEVDH